MLEARDVDVANLLFGPVAEGCNRSIGGHRRARRTALAHADIERAFNRLFPVAPVGREPQAHGPCRGAVAAVPRIGLHGAAVEPHETEAGTGHLKEGSETVLGGGAVVVRRERRRPRLALVGGVGEAHVIRVCVGTALLKPVCRERSVREAQHRGNVSPVHEPVAAGRNHARRRPPGRDPLRVLQGRSLGFFLHPAEHHAAIRDRQLRLRTAAWRGRREALDGWRPWNGHRTLKNNGGKPEERGQERREPDGHGRDHIPPANLRRCSARGAPEVPSRVRKALPRR